jgi:protein gp37
MRPSTTWTSNRSAQRVITGERGIGMADQRDGGISWTDRTWNPVRGCSRVSEGCRNCYAEGVAARFSAPGLAYAGLARQGDNGPRWTGKVVMVPEHLDDPIRWKKPRRIFVNSMSDLFHEKLTDEQIASVFRVMLNAPRHTYQILTKRAERMRTFVNWFLADTGLAALPPFIWLGVSVEDQTNANERIPELLATPVAVRFLSAEPLLGPINLHAHLCVNGRVDMPEQRFANICDGNGLLQWIIVGGESGRHARPFEIAWARSIRDQCRAAGVAVFIKQLGAVPIVDADTNPAEWPEGARIGKRTTDGRWQAMLDDGHGGNPATWPEDLRVREFPQLSNAPP